MTDAQVQYGAGFWTQKLRLNTEVTDAQAKAFAKSLEGLMQKLGTEVAICSDIQPCSILRAALKQAGIDETFWPKVKVDTVFHHSGTVDIWENNAWRSVTPN